MIEMPRVIQVPSPNYTPSAISHDLVILHMMEGGYSGSVAWLCNPTAQASAHLCMKADGSEVTQLVPLQFKAWAQKAFNSKGVSLEIEGFTAKGLTNGTIYAAAKIAAWLCRAYAIPPVWAQRGQGRGICSHHDLGAAGGNHFDICGVGDATWLRMIEMIKSAYDELGDFPLPPFALHGLPNPRQVAAPPNIKPEPSHNGEARKEPLDTVQHPTITGYPHGSMADFQARLNLVGASPALKIDGVFGSKTRAATIRFQATHGCGIDGVAGPETWAALDKV